MNVLIVRNPFGNSFRVIAVNTYNIGHIRDLVMTEGSMIILISTLEWLKHIEKL